LTKVADERRRHRCVRRASPLPMVSGSRRRSCRRRAQQAHYPGAHKRIHRNDAELPIVVDEQTPEQRCPDEQHVSAPRRGQLAVLTASADAMRDLPLRKMPEEVILSLATTWNPVDVGLRASGRKALLASTTWSGRRDVLARQGVTGTRISRVTPAGSVIFSGSKNNLTAACSDEKRAKGEKCHDRPI
jgi:hypothetical protein